MDEFVPNTDGVNHINVYSKSRSRLGRLLSNFAHTPITLDGDKFESIESWWYWKKMVKINESQLFPVFTEQHLFDIKGKVGKEAKDYFRSLFEDESYMFNPLKEELLEAYKQKLTEHPEIKEMLLGNKLPIAHYYMMFDKQISADSSLWTAKLWEEAAEWARNLL
jgi:predicted NAD-dependent protein-ADP-ribosyltransferase YbiA (DUF1768 family)